MSKGKGNAAEAAQESSNAPTRQFLSVNGKSLSNEGSDINFVSASRLNKAGVTNEVVAEGIYTESQIVTGKFGPKTEYKILNDGKLTIIGEAGNLKSQMSKVATGSYVQITYVGKEAMTGGERKGTLAHKFLVGVAQD